MSSRHIRQLMAQKEQEKEKESEESSEDQDDEPYVQQRQTFQGLEVSSDSEPEEPANEDSSPTMNPVAGPSGLNQRSANIPEEDKYGAKKKVYTEAELAKKEKIAQKKSKKNKEERAPPGMNEIDWLTEQMNRRLGIAPNRVEGTVDRMEVDRRDLRKQQLFYINPDHLDVNIELAKVYGKNDMKSPSPLNRRSSHWIGVSPNIQAIRIKGIVMTCYKTEGRTKFFRFTHTQEYRTRCQELIRKIKGRLYGGEELENILYSLTCVEACLENCDILFTLDEHSEGRLSLEQGLFCMQFVAEPSFSFVDGNTRLLYDFVENRPFLIGLLKYIHILSNTACHITALALSKVLLNLDPSDPLAVLFIIDTLAIRAREFKWLITLIDVWRGSRNANRLFNIRYSRALALFQIARRAKESEEEADKALLKAIICYPTTAMKIAELAKISIPDDVKKHVLFNPPENYPVPSSDLQKMMNFYAWLIAPRWREPFVSKWFIRVLRSATTKYDESSALREEALMDAKLVAQLYRHLPSELRRHIHSIRSMSNYIGGGHMPVLEASVSFNPYPMKGYNIDTYKYFEDWSRPYEPPSNALVGFIEGLYPNFGRFGVGPVTSVLREFYGSGVINRNNRYAVNLIEEILMYLRLAASRPNTRDGYSHAQAAAAAAAAARDPEMNAGSMYGINFPIGNENNSIILQQIFEGGYNAVLPGRSSQTYDIEEVEITYRRVVDEDDDYLSAVFLTDEEWENPLHTAKVLVIYVMALIQLARFNSYGEFLLGSRYQYKRFIELPMNAELTFEEPLLE